MLWIQAVGQGPPLVLLHPVGTSGRIWWRHIPRLARRFRVLAVDLPGHGRSPRPKEPVSIDEMAEGLYKTLKKRSLLPAHVVGLSLGGLVTQMLVVNHPASVFSFTLCDTICEVDPAAAKIFEERARAVEQQGMAATVKPTLERWFAPDFFDRHPDVVAVVEKLLMEADPEINAQTWRAIAGFNVISRLRTLSCRPAPALVIKGTMDTSAPPGMQKCLADHYGAGLEELPGCGHMAPVEAPEKFMDLLESFLLRQ